MAVAKKKSSAQAVGRAFAELARHESVIHEVWVSEHPEIHIWAIVDPIDMETTRHLHGLIGPLFDQFPTADFQLHVLNPDEHRGDIHRAVPSFAEQIPFRAN
jgi:hypothetical protein